eukprot:SM006370S19835  [mRNA]  locus=s6370:54:704:+ [translate_table: standard]
MAPPVRQRDPPKFSDFVSPAPAWVKIYWKKLAAELRRNAPADIHSDNEAASSMHDTVKGAAAALLEPLIAEISLEEFLAAYLGSKLENSMLPSELWARLLQEAFCGTVTFAAGTPLYVSELVCKDLQVAKGLVAVGLARCVKLL